MRLALLTSLVLLLPAAAAHAACAPELAAAADEVQLGAGLSPARLQAVRVACGENGPASLVATLVTRGACDHASQLGRSLVGQPGMEGALTSADACLNRSLEETLDALDAVAQAEPMSASPVDADTAMKSRRSSGLLGASTGGLENLGSRGAGRGGAGMRARAATGMAPSARAQAKIGTRGPVAYSRLSLGIWFDYDSAALRSEALGTVGALARQLRSMDGAAVLEVAGHTDSSGSYWYNADLSERRARAVWQALVLAGVSPERLTVVGMGEDQPMASNASAWGRAQNRRVEFRFYKAVASRNWTR